MDSDVILENIVRWGGYSLIYLLPYYFSRSFVLAKFNAKISTNEKLFAYLRSIGSCTIVSIFLLFIRFIDDEEKTKVFDWNLIVSVIIAVSIASYLGTYHGFKRLETK